MKRLIILLLCLLFLPSVAMGGVTTVYPDETILENIKEIRFDVDYTNNCDEGVAYWNQDDATLNIGITGDVCLQVGQEQLVRVTNKTGVQIDNGKAVYINGAQGNRPTVALANAVAESTSSKTVGIATEDIANNGNGYVTTFGLVRDIDTSGFSEGDTLWLSTTPGGIQNTVPVTPNHATFMGVCVVSSASEGIILTKVQNGFELYELHDVSSFSSITNDLLAYNGTAWMNTADIFVNSITYSDTYWEDLRFPAAGIRVGPSFPPSFTSYGIGNLIAPEFIDSADRYVHIDAQLPHSYKLGTDIEMHIHFTSGSNTNTGNIEWVFECENLADMGETWTGTAIYNAVTALDGTAQKHYYLDTGELDSSGVTGVSAMAGCRINRNTSVSGDATGSVWLREIDFHYQLNTPGSETEMAK